MSKLFMIGKDVIKKLHQAGFEAYFVGGAVRDYVRNVPINDIDIATSATIKQINHIFPKTIHIGVNHETIIVRHKGESFEVTPFRSHMNNELPTLTTDLTYRDFTMNAMAMDDHFTIIDPWNGRQAIDKQMIIAVEDGAARIKEDPLRIIRAFRFMSETGYSIETNTVHAIQDHKQLLLNIAVERINMEWKKLLLGKNAYSSIEMMFEMNIHHFLPVFQQYPFLFTNIIERKVSIETIPQMITFMHILERNIPISIWIDKWKCSNEEKNEVIHLVTIYDEMQETGITDWLIYQLNDKYMASFISLYQMLHNDHKLNKDLLVKQKSNLSIQNKTQLAIQPLQLIEMYPTYPKGKWISHTLEQLERLVVTKQLQNEENILKEWILCHPPEIN